MTTATFPTDELDSYMYQTVGHGAISLYAEAMDLPLYRATIRGTTRASDREYSPTEGDEVEDLHRLLARVQVRYVGTFVVYSLCYMSVNGFDSVFEMRSMVNQRLIKARMSCQFGHFYTYFCLHVDSLKCFCFPQTDITFEAVSVGAILSDYQRVRVENV